MQAEFPLLKIPAQVPIQVQAELQKIGPVVAPVPTEALYAPLSERMPISGISTQRDVSYGPHARHLLDIFHSDGANGGRPILLFVHGGAFIRGDRRIGDSPFNDNIAIWAARQGLVGVNMTYRLAPEHAWPAAQYDIRNALAWLRGNAAAWGGDANQIILMGHSAGAAHIAQYLAFPQFHLEHGPGIEGAVMLSGIFDPVTAECNASLRAYFGDDVTLYSGMSAVGGMISSRTPQLIAYAELDPTDFVRQAHGLGVAMRQAGKIQPIYQLNGHSHMSAVYSINTPDKSLMKLFQEFFAPVFEFHRSA
jgi:triacylglycerol lipase